MTMDREERRLLAPSGDVTLEAVLHIPGGMAPRALVVVCHPHPLYGGSMDNNVVAAICEAALQEGMAALRFNFRGVGKSSGRHDNGAGEQLDILAMLAFAAELPGGSRSRPGRLLLWRRDRGLGLQTRARRAQGARARITATTHTRSRAFSGENPTSAS